jgi:hypothetical protein
MKSTCLQLPLRSPAPRVVAALAEAEVAHFACHATADLRRPLDSAILLHDGPDPRAGARTVRYLRLTHNLRRHCRPDERWYATTVPPTVPRALEVSIEAERNTGAISPIPL